MICLTLPEGIHFYLPLPCNGTWNLYLQTHLRSLPHLVVGDNYLFLPLEIEARLPAWVEYALTTGPPFCFYHTLLQGSHFELTC